MKKSSRVLVTGAGGFIGHHLVRRLKTEGFWVRGADLKAPAYYPSVADEFLILDLRRWENCLRASKDVDRIYNLAADMGGIGYIKAHCADISRHNTLINTHMLEAARQSDVKRFLFTSSACVYPEYKQQEATALPLREVDAIPADPEPGYGWEKLYTEQLCRYYTQDYGFETRVVRFHNTYGPFGAYDGGREKSPHAISRKVALAHDGGEIEVWGDGKQTRSFVHVDDCVEGVLRIMDSDYSDALNLGTNRLVTIDELIDIICAIDGKRLTKRYDLSKPQGVRGRNSDNTMLKKVLEWEPTISLEQGLVGTYRWIEGELRKEGRISSRVPE